MSILNFSPIAKKNWRYQMVNSADEILFRSSSTGYLMTDPRSKTETLSETTKTHLIDVFVSEKYGRREEIQGKALDKGNECEEDGITLLSRVNKKFYKKNEDHLSNEFIKGTPDTYEGKAIFQADVIIDTKLSWSAHTFFRAQKELNKLYEWQVLSYMWLTGAKEAYVAYCLVNGTAAAIDDEKRRLGWKMGVIDPGSNPEYIDKCKQIEINHIFDLELFVEHNPNYDLYNNYLDWKYDIPIEERVFKFHVMRDNEKIEKLRQRIIDCREWMNKELFKV